MRAAPDQVNSPGARCIWEASGRSKPDHGCASFRRMDIKSSRIPKFAIESLEPADNSRPRRPDKLKQHLYLPRSCIMCITTQASSLLVGMAEAPCAVMSCNNFAIPGKSYCSEHGGLS
ncbi:hypothetical protein AUP68_00006 [Ilyonectria robusta]